MQNENSRNRVGRRAERRVAGVEDADLGAVLDELVAREPLFHRTERGTSRAAFEAMTADDFWELGASGARYDREVVWTVPQRRCAAPGGSAHDGGDGAGQAPGGLRRLREEQARLGELQLQDDRPGVGAPAQGRTGGGGGGGGAD